MPDKQDMLDRKLATGERWFDKLFSAIQKDVKGTTIALLFLYCFIITYLYIDEVKTSSDEMIEEVRRTARAEAKIQVTEQMKPIEAEQKEQGKKADTTLTNFNETVQKFKEKYLPNTEK